ncbi:MAG: zinc ribbon domain-containing protein [Chloroflexia bacterium]|nr:zinc ribbon domain-containing protein [Chloroflexia bacterium]
MPTYGYQCQACAHAFDVFQKFAEAPLTVCPECQGHIRRVIHPTPVVFKGSGWYINDSKAKPKADGDPAKPKDDGGDAKTAKADAAEKKTDNDKSPAKTDKAEKGDKGEKKTAAPVAATAD